MKRKLLILFLSLSLIATGCSNSSSGNNNKEEGSTNSETNNNNGTNNEQNNTTNVTMPDTSTLFTERDYETDYKENKSALITLNGTSATCTSNAVKISGSTITITDEGTYVLKGNLENGMIVSF